ncbi:MAG: hypothetical protein LUD12_00715 [Lachnospiraceae bacterium]|nr:hypothetical protein [Lachnospiraceae bacterium]
MSRFSQRIENESLVIEQSSIQNGEALQNMSRFSQRIEDEGLAIEQSSIQNGEALPIAFRENLSYGTKKSRNI